MTYTKHNIKSIIDQYLTSKKIRYNIIENDDKVVFYELYVSSLIGNIQVEYDLTNDDDNFIMVSFFITNSDDTIIYDTLIDSDDESSDIENEIDELIEKTKRLNTVYNKIQTKIEQIKDICEENELNLDTFLSINYNFD